MRDKSIKLFLLILLTICVLIVSFFSITKNKQSEKNHINTWNENKKEGISIKNTNEAKITSSTIEEELYNCGKFSNAGEFECVKDIFLKLSAERVWKQKKLENIKHPEINKFEFGLIEEAQANIKKWRFGFDKARDEWCLATVHSYVNGSSIPEEEYRCRIEIEKKAIEDLDSIYYEQIMDMISGSKGIIDFEPISK